MGTLSKWALKIPIYYGWIILGVASLGTFASTGSAQVTLAGVQNFILEGRVFADDVICCPQRCLCYKGNIK